jgi:anti-sigma-K factor RskA
MNDTTGDTHSLLGPYIVGAVDDLERATFEHHLGECADCREEVEQMADVIATLVDAETTAPPASLRGKVMEQVARTPQVPPRTWESGQTARTTRRRIRWPLAGAAAAAVIAIASVGMLVINTDDSPDTSAMERDVMMVSSAPDAHTMELGLGASHLIMSERMQSVALMGHDAPMPSDGMEYQLWLVMDDGKMMPGPTFMPDAEGEFMAVMHTGFEGVSTFEITEEPHGGSGLPTGDVVAAISL